MYIHTPLCMPFMTYNCVTMHSISMMMMWTNQSNIQKKKKRINPLTRGAQVPVFNACDIKCMYFWGKIGCIKPISRETEHFYACIFITVTLWPCAPISLSVLQIHRECVISVHTYNTVPLSCMDFLTKDKGA